MRIRHSIPLITTLVALTLSACYKLTPIEGGMPAPGTEVRLKLSDEGSVRLAPLIGPRIGAIDGLARSSTDTALVLAVQAVVSQGGRSMPWSLEQLAVPRTAVSSVQGRTLDRTRSWLVAGLGVAAVIGIGEAFGLGTGFDGLFGWVGGGGGKR